MHWYVILIAVIGILFGIYLVLIGVGNNNDLGAIGAGIGLVIFLVIILVFDIRGFEFS